MSDVAVLRQGGGVEVTITDESAVTALLMGLKEMCDLHFVLSDGDIVYKFAGCKKGHDAPENPHISIMLSMKKNGE